MLRNIKNISRIIKPKFFNYNKRYFNQDKKPDFDNFMDNEKENFQSEEEEFRENKNKIYIYACAGLTLTCLYIVYQINLLQDNNKKKLRVVKHKGKPDIGGSWELIGPENKPFGSDDLKGKYYLIYFGFCNCPDICPQTMKKIAKAVNIINDMPEKKYFDLEYLFVSVDPDRDTIKKMQTFKSQFHNDIITVTGKDNKDKLLRDMMKKFKIYASKIEIEDENGKTKDNHYYLDHTIITYLMSKDNTYLSHIGGSMNGNDVANYVVDQIMDYEKSY